MSAQLDEVTTHGKYKHAESLVIRRLAHVSPQAGNASRVGGPVVTGTEAEEVLVADERCGLRPAQVVEQKLQSLLRSVLLPMSQIRLSTLYRGRRCG